MRGFFDNDDMTWGEVVKIAVLAIILTMCFIGAIAALPHAAEALNTAINYRSAAVPCEGLLTR